MDLTRLLNTLDFYEKKLTAALAADDDVGAARVNGITVGLVWAAIETLSAPDVSRLIQEMNKRRIVWDVMVQTVNFKLHP